MGCNTWTDRVQYSIPKRHIKDKFHSENSVSFVVGGGGWP